MGTEELAELQVPPTTTGPADRIPAQRQAGQRADPDSLVSRAAVAFTDYRNGVPGSIDVLVKLVTPVLWHTARACGLGNAESEDAVQQTFVVLVRQSHTITDPQAVVRWLTVTLRRQAWRDRAAGRLQGAEPTDADLPSQPSAEALALLGDEQRRLWEQVTKLPERCRKLLRVIAFAPRPDYAALAEELGMPMGSIGPTRGRCLAKLRRELDKEGWR